MMFRESVAILLVVLLLGCVTATSPTNPCTEAVCLTGHTCKVLNGTDFACLPSCTADANCTNGGTCNSTTGVCSCLGPYSGGFCEMINMIALTDTLVNGCVYGTVGTGLGAIFYECLSCGAGFVGPTCTQLHASSVPFEYFMTLMIESGGWFPSSLRGTAAASMIDMCTHATVTCNSTTHEILNFALRAVGSMIYVSGLSTNTTTNTVSRVHYSSSLVFQTWPAAPDVVLDFSNNQNLQTLILQALTSDVNVTALFGGPTFTGAHLRSLKQFEVTPIVDNSVANWMTNGPVGAINLSSITTLTTVVVGGTFSSFTMGTNTTSLKMLFYSSGTNNSHFVLPSYLSTDLISLQLNTLFTTTQYDATRPAGASIIDPSVIVPNTLNTSTHIALIDGVFPSASVGTPFPSLLRWCVNGLTFTGEVPANLLSLAPALSSFCCNDCGLSGTVPQTYYDMMGEVLDAPLSISLSHNSLTGTLPAVWAHLNGTELIDTPTFNFTLSYNMLQGTLPSTFFFGAGAARMYSSLFGNDIACTADISYDAFGNDYPLVCEACGFCTAGQGICNVITKGCVCLSGFYDSPLPDERTPTCALSAGGRAFCDFYAGLTDQEGWLDLIGMPALQCNISLCDQFAAAPHLTTFTVPYQSSYSSRPTIQGPALVCNSETVVAVLLVSSDPTATLPDMIWNDPNLAKVIYYFNMSAVPHGTIIAPQTMFTPSFYTTTVAAFDTLSITMPYATDNGIIVPDDSAGLDLPGGLASVINLYIDCLDTGATWSNPTELMRRIYAIQANMNHVLINNCDLSALDLAASSNGLSTGGTTGATPYGSLLTLDLSSNHISGWLPSNISMMGDLINTAGILVLAGNDFLMGDVANLNALGGGLVLRNTSASGSASGWHSSELSTVTYLYLANTPISCGNPTVDYSWVTHNDFVEFNDTCASCATNNPCQNGATCSEDEAGVVVCNCAGDFRGPFCQFAKTEVCQYHVSPCTGNGACTNVGGSSTCACYSGFQGQTCQSLIDDDLELVSYSLAGDVDLGLIELTVFHSQVYPYYVDNGTINIAQGTTSTPVHVGGLVTQQTQFALTYDIHSQFCNALVTSGSLNLTLTFGLGSLLAADNITPGVTIRTLIVPITYTCKTASQTNGDFGFPKLGGLIQATSINDTAALVTIPWVLPPLITVSDVTLGVSVWNITNLTSVISITAPNVDWDVSAVKVTISKGKIAQFVTNWGLDPSSIVTIGMAANMKVTYLNSTALSNAYSVPQTAPTTGSQSLFFFGNVTVNLSPGRQPIPGPPNWQLNVGLAVGVGAGIAVVAHATYSLLMWWYRG